MSSGKLKKIGAFTLAALCIGALAGGAVRAAYISTSRDTLPAPDKAESCITDVSEFEKLYESGKYIYYFKEDRDILAIENKETGYIMKTGIDEEFSSVIENEAVTKDTFEEKLEVGSYIENNMNDTFMGIANSLVTVEYREPDAPDTVKNISSASKKGAKSELKILNDNPATRRLDVKMTTIDLKFHVYITFGEDEITYRVPFDEIEGEGKAYMCSINISPFFGSSGGEHLLLNEESEMYDIPEPQYMVPGYIFVPDGSGALIRFADNDMAFTEYVGSVYGQDPGAGQYYSNTLGDAVPLKDPSMPVFGVAHGDRQAGFVAYATSGEEYMQIVARPEGNKSTNYNWVYPRFTYNDIYYQVYNQNGDGFFTLNDVVNDFDLEITYKLLSGDGSKDGYPADYVGMAKAYRDHLISEGILTPVNKSEGNIPVRVDFIMSDVKSGVVGNTSVSVTTAENAKNILESLKNDGVSNINTGLIGWQKGGTILARADKAKYNPLLGSKKDFESLMKDMSDEGIDVSLVNNYVTINKEMISYYRNAVKHINSWYVNENREYILAHNVPVMDYGFALPERSAGWLSKAADRFDGISESLSIEGIGSILTSNFDDERSTSRSKAKEIIQEAVKEAGENFVLNIDRPGTYLWQYTDRYLNSPIGHSQYVYETDSVPFLQMVLNGTMEVYAPYSNFSFYTDKDLLKMIDYNLYPSFILSEDPSYKLAPTASGSLYSTEYDLYKDVIPESYEKVNEVLSKVSGYTWTDRTVPYHGVVINTYEKDGITIKVIINYTEEAVTVENTTVEPLSATVVR